VHAAGNAEELEMTGVVLVARKIAARSLGSANPVRTFVGAGNEYLQGREVER